MENARRQIEAKGKVLVPWIMNPYRKANVWKSEMTRIRLTRR